MNLASSLSPDLANKGYAEILSASAAKGMDYRRIMLIMNNMLANTRGFMADPEVFEQYSNTFWQAIRFAMHVESNNLDVDRNLPEEERYIISPAGGRANNGRPVGLREVPNLPECLELFFVTPDINAHAIDDFFELGQRRGFIIKGVDELPPDMVRYAEANKLRLR
jgi:hypothetical protein